MRPPSEIWLDEEALTAHFEAVKDRLKSGSGGDDSESIPTEQNELTKGLR